MSEIAFVVAPVEEGTRLDTLVAVRTGLSRTAGARLVQEGAATVEGRARARSFRVSAGERVRVLVPEPVAEALPEPEEIDVPIRYEDGHLLVVSKPAGLVVHPAPGHPAGTVVNALLARAGRPAGGDLRRPGIVHRLDAGTSGLMIVAKEQGAFERLSEMIANREVTRVYHTLVEGVPATTTGTIDAPIGRSPRHRRKMAVVAEGREAVTDFRVLEPFREASLLEARPRTGRTHQIRVHLAATGHPVIGDAVYGRDRKLAKRLGLQRPFLHAAALRFVHPVTGEEVSLEDPLPPDLLAALASLRAEAR